MVLVWTISYMDHLEDWHKQHHDTGYMDHLEDRHKQHMVLVRRNGYLDYLEDRHKQHHCTG